MRPRPSRRSRSSSTAISSARRSMASRAPMLRFHFRRCATARIRAGDSRWIRRSSRTRDTASRYASWIHLASARRSARSISSCRTPTRYRNAGILPAGAPATSRRTKHTASPSSQLSPGCRVHTVLTELVHLHRERNDRSTHATKMSLAFSEARSPDLTCTISMNEGFFPNPRL